MPREQSKYSLDVQIKILDKKIGAVESGIRILGAGMAELKRREGIFSKVPTGEQLEFLVKKYGSQEAVENRWADFHQDAKNLLSQREVTMVDRQRILGELKSEREVLVKKQDGPDVKKNEPDDPEHGRGHSGPSR